MDTKVFWKSKMFYLNLFGVILMGADWIVGHGTILSTIGLSPEVVSTVLFIANILRKFSSPQAMVTVTDRRL